MIVKACDSIAIDPGTSYFCAFTPELPLPSIAAVTGAGVSSFRASPLIPEPLEIVADLVL
jgi:hypothetical protein